jgi:23S rRNA pseudouridine2457 synthase
VPDVYAAGRLDADSEGLLLLTAEGRLQQRLTDPRFGHWRTYWVQVDGEANPDQLQRLRSGVLVQGRQTLPAKAEMLAKERLSNWPERDPPIRVRRSLPTCWLEISLREGRNRQVRRMTAAVGLPTLRLIRTAIDLMDGQPPLSLGGLDPGQWRSLTSNEQQRLQALLKRPAASRRG